MIRGVGDEEGQEIVPPVLEVKAEIVMPPADFQGPHLPTTFMAPFRTSIEFGQWLYDVLVNADGTSTTFTAMHTLFVNFTVSPKLKALRRLIRYGKRIFTTVHRIYFLEGLLMITGSKRQQNCISRIRGANLAMLWRNELSKVEYL